MGEQPKARVLQQELGCFSLAAPLSPLMMQTWRRRGQGEERERKREEKRREERREERRGGEEKKRREEKEREREERRSEKKGGKRKTFRRERGKSERRKIEKRENRGRRDSVRHRRENERGKADLVSKFVFGLPGLAPTMHLLHSLPTYHPPGGQPFPGTQHGMSAISDNKNGGG